MNNFSPRQCLQCGKSLTGRVDKKFCDAYCRNSYNNQNKSNDELMIKATNTTLRKNRRILKSLCPEGKTVVRRKVLVDMGFDHRYFTNIYRSSKGNTYYLCYDYGFAPIKEGGKDKILIIHRQDYMDSYSPVSS